MRSRTHRTLQTAQQRPDCSCWASGARASTQRQTSIGTITKNRSVRFGTPSVLSPISIAVRAVLVAAFCHISPRTLENVQPNCTKKNVSLENFFYTSSKIDHAAHNTCRNTHLGKEPTIGQFNIDSSTPPSRVLVTLTRLRTMMCATFTLYIPVDKQPNACPNSHMMKK